MEYGRPGRERLPLFVSDIAPYRKLFRNEGLPELPAAWGSERYGVSCGLIRKPTSAWDHVELLMLLPKQAINCILAVAPVTT